MSKLTSTIVPTEGKTIKKFSHIPKLDGIRAIAVLVVFFGHTKIVSSFPAGFGVTIFFFLSGYLITSLLRVEFENYQKIDIKSFFLRRLFRINPPLWISMAAMGLMVVTGFLDIKIAWADVFSQAFFFANYMPGFAQAGGLPSPLWSLAVEEHFYLLFPFIFWKISENCRSHRMIFVSICLCAVVLAIRLLNVLLFRIYDENYYWTHTRIDSILFGSLLALWRNPALERVREIGLADHVAFAIANMAIVASFFIKGPVFEFGLKYTVQGVALYIVFSYILRDGSFITKTLTWPILQKIGLYSYTIYLSHYAFIISVRQAFPDLNLVLQAVISGSLSLGFAYGMYVLVERPMGNLRRRIERRPPNVAAT